VAFAPHDRDPGLGRLFTPDKWDGYVADRQRVLDFLAEQRLTNTVVITGDAHANSVRNVPASFTSLDGPPIATEFIGTSISSEGDPPSVVTRFGGDVNNPHILFQNNQRGYVRVVLERERWTSEFRVMSTVRQPEATASTLATFVVDNRAPGAQQI